jgi:hypothetical protein
MAAQIPGKRMKRAGGGPRGYGMHISTTANATGEDGPESGQPREGARGNNGRGEEGTERTGHAGGHPRNVGKGPQGMLNAQKRGRGTQTNTKGPRNVARPHRGRQMLKNVGGGPGKRGKGPGQRGHETHRSAVRRPRNVGKDPEGMLKAEKFRRGAETHTVPNAEEHEGPKKCGSDAQRAPNAQKAWEGQEDEQKE